MSDNSIDKSPLGIHVNQLDPNIHIPEDLVNELTEEDYEFLKIKQVPQRWYQWFAITDTKAERKLIIKLDLLILVYLFLSSFVKTLDTSAVSYAYVSGMKEDLGMYGNQLTYQNSCFMAGFIVGQIPLTMLGTKLPIHLYLPIMDSIWSIFTLALFKITNYHQLYALRFCIGLFGSFFFPFCQYILGSWYTENELTKRSALYFCASQVGGMAAGYIQAGAYKHLSGLHGLEGWRWLYILAFIITLPISLYGVLTLPGLPDKIHNNRLLTPNEIKLARLRMIREGRSSKDRFSISVILQIIKGWRFWILVVFAIFFSQADGISSQNGLPIWLKAENYSVYQVNTITTVIPAVTIFFSLLNGIIVDSWKDSHPYIIAYVAIFNLLSGILLTIWKIPKNAIMFAFFLSGTADSIAAVLYSWANIICSNNSQERALTLSTMNTLGNTFGVWVPLFVWKTSDAPRYLKGYAYNIGLDSMMLILLVPLTILYRRNKEHTKIDDSNDDEIDSLE
ncbi:Vitamin H transporter [Wickerhamomyces ciferrii]|uniref:Vitamin H transporter n=1 Tax=Wickerhamomyces ciferrii (strain ATCC 14091 / BCRC 22168 / CBS 111 / JCM 3599 / NBRC 0793 / NRRL Y-1031 F-60-10) TaxID=1206466 RepID=K0KJ31_WICCF|nr:Vitamin H transporter [Wickerhamomyces ciferrii]CCH41484.1 Vitamin H transporter [Wickerhamomyces ciferrii]